MKQLITIALGVALGIAGYVCINRYLHTHSATVVVQRRANVNGDEFRYFYPERSEATQVPF